MLEREARRLRACELDLSGWGVFPEKGHANIFWAGVEPAAAVRELFEHCEAAMESCGFARETREFDGHVTLAREGTSPVPADFLSHWRALVPIEGPVRFRVDRVSLYESRTHASGPVYQKLGEPKN